VLRLHAQGRGQVARRRRHAAGTSPTRSTPTSATARRRPRSTARACRCTTSSSRANRRGAHLEARARPVARLAPGRKTTARAQDPRLVKASPLRTTSTPGDQLLQETPPQGRAAGAEADRLAAARRRAPRDGPSRRPKTSTSARRLIPDLGKVRLNQGDARLKRARRVEEPRADSLLDSAAAPSGGRSRDNAKYGIQARASPTFRCSTGSAAAGLRRPILDTCRSARHHDPSPRGCPENRCLSIGPGSASSRRLGRRERGPR